MALNKGRRIPTRPPRPKAKVTDVSKDGLVNISFRNSMQSEYAVHYHLTTDLSTGEVERRLRGNWLDRLNTWYRMNKYKRWEKAMNAKRFHKVLTDSNNLTDPSLSRKNGDLL
jgi:hypothetical protein